MTNHPNRSNHPSPRFKATYRGDVLGWYDTQAEAEAAIEAAREDEKREEQEWLRNKP
jgi:hypothetical protein